MVVQRIGPQKWLTFQVLAFGLVATFQMFMNSYGSFLATRILLGVCECGCKLDLSVAAGGQGLIISQTSPVPSTLSPLSTSDPNSVAETPSFSLATFSFLVSVALWLLASCVLTVL